MGWIDGDAAALLLRGATWQRILGNAEVFIGRELEGVHAYLPSREELAAVQVQCTVAAAAEHRDPAHECHWLYEAAQWLASGLRAPFLDTPGGHLPQVTHPEALADFLAPIFRAGAAVDSARIA